MASTSAAPQKKGGFGEYLKGVRTELKKVVWPTRKETYKYTLVVLFVCLVFCVLFWLLDTGFLALLEQVLNISM